MKKDRASYLGKKFKHRGIGNIYTIDPTINTSGKVYVRWEHDGGGGWEYATDTVAEYFKNGSWKLISEEEKPLVRTFGTGANRNSDEGKLDFEGFLSPMVLKKYAEYMHKNRYLANGDIRDSDNWQKGIPVPAYMKSMYRHFFDTWSNYRGHETPETQVQNLCGLLFNTMGMLHEILKEESK